MCVSYVWSLLYKIAAQAYHALMIAQGERLASGAISFVKKEPKGGDTIKTVLEEIYDTFEKNKELRVITFKFNEITYDINREFNVSVSSGSEKYLPLMQDNITELLRRKKSFLKRVLARF